VSVGDSPFDSKAPHGHLNPHGFDYELWLWEQKLQATGYVRVRRAEILLLARLGTSLAHPIERRRQDAREAIEHRIPDRAMSGVIAGLAGGRSAELPLNVQTGTCFALTGVAHLMSISGLHITGFSVALAARSDSMVLAWQRCVVTTAALVLAFACAACWPWSWDVVWPSSMRCSPVRGIPAQRGRY
jgi:competence protein ComEC